MSKSDRPRTTLRPYLPADAPMLAEIFRASIEELTGEDYSPSQQEAWASAADNVEAFGITLSQILTLVALIEGAPAGFASLKGNDHLHMLYVHPQYVGQGVATDLCKAVEILAAARGTARLSADVSDTAEEFFKKLGFAPIRRNTVPRNGEWLANTTMEKTLVPSQPGKLSS